MSTFSFLHLADLHLDSPFIGLKDLPEKLHKRLQESTFLSFTKLISAAIENKVDFLIIAGDLFDIEDRSIRAQVRFRREMERLQEENIQVYVIHGNHDHLGGQWMDLEMPSNVHVFTDEQVEVKTYIKDGIPLVNLYGFSYLQKAVTENKTVFYKRKEGVPYHIGILHGSADGESLHPSYAPFTMNQLLDKGFDYWALGHIHKRQFLSNLPPIHYPGNIQGRNRKEIGDKGGTLVRFNATNAETTFIPSADIVWEQLMIDCSLYTTMNQLIDECYNRINRMRMEEKGTLITLELLGSSHLNQEIGEHLDDLIEVLRDGEVERANFVYVYSIKQNTTEAINREELKRNSPFINELLSYFDSYQEVNEAIAPLMNQPGTRKILTAFTDEEQQEIVKSAENYILQQLYKSFSTRG